MSRGKEQKEKLLGKKLWPVANQKEDPLGLGIMNDLTLFCGLRLLALKLKYVASIYTKIQSSKLFSIPVDE